MRTVLCGFVVAATVAAPSPALAAVVPEMACTLAIAETPFGTQPPFDPTVATAGPYVAPADATSVTVTCAIQAYSDDPVNGSPYHRFSHTSDGRIGVLAQAGVVPRYGAGGRYLCTIVTWASPSGGGRFDTGPCRGPY